jgi:hypothetical protein
VAKGKVSEGRTRAEQALDAGKKAARAARSELEERLAQGGDSGEEDA